MVPEKAAVILNTIYRRTMDGAIAWTATSTDDAFEVSYEKETLRVVHEDGVDNDTGEPFSYYFIEILNPQGKTIDSIKPYPVSDYFDKPNAWRITEAIFSMARDKALGVGEIADDLLENLGGAIPPSSLDESIPF